MRPLLNRQKQIGIKIHSSGRKYRDKIVFDDELTGKVSKVGRFICSTALNYFVGSMFKSAPTPTTASEAGRILVKKRWQ